MLHYLNQHIAPAARAVGERVVFANVSRRSFLKGTAWGTGAVIAASILPFGARQGVRDLSAWRPRHAARHRHRPACVRLDRARRHGHDRRPPLGDGHRLAHQPADGDRRRDGGRLGAGQDRPGAGRRAQIRQPGHRRLAQHAPPHPVDAPDRRDGARDAEGGRGQAVGGRRRRGQGGQPRGPARGTGQQARLRRSRRRPWRRWRSRPSGTQPDRRAAALQGRERVPLHRQGQGADLRPARHHHRQGGLWRRRPAARHEVRGGRAPAGGRRQGQVGRRQRRQGGRRASSGSCRSRAACRRPSSRRSAASRWSPTTPGRRSRAATRSRSSGTTARTAPTTPSSTTRRCRRPRPSPAR